MSLTIEITIPILNEEDTLYKQVHTVHNYLEENLCDFGSIKIVLADNGSTDRTSEIAQILTQELDAVCYLRLNERGVGRALKSSWTQSNADIIGYMDLDLSTDLSYIRPALEKIRTDRADIVTGSRLIKGAQVIGRSFLRNFTSRGLNCLIKIFFHTSFTDGMCGFKFLKRHCLKKIIAAGAQSNGWFFATELLIAGEYLDYRVSDIPIKWTDDPNSKVKIVYLIFEYLKAMKILRDRLLERKKIT